MKTQYFFQALTFKNGYFNLIYQNADGFTGYYRTNFVDYSSVNKLSRNLKPWASIFAENPIAETKAIGSLTYTFM